MVKKTYTRAFKLKVVQVVEAGEFRPAQACREYQIAASVLNRWRHEVRFRGTEQAFTSLRSSVSSVANAISGGRITSAARSGISRMIMSRQKAISLPAATRAARASSPQSSAAITRMTRWVSVLAHVSTSMVAAPKT